MSCSLWRWTEECDSRPCPGDCDLCEENFEEENFEESHTIPYTECVTVYEEKIS